MGRPGRRVQRSAQGWSLMQVARAAGVTERAARTCVERGYLDGRALTGHDVARLKVAVSLLDAPRALDGAPRTTVTMTAGPRDKAAMAAITELLAQPHPSREAVLLVSPTEVLVAANALLVAGHLQAFGPVPVLILPVGIWAHEARELVAALQAEQDDALVGGHRETTEGRRHVSVPDRRYLAAARSPRPTATPATGTGVRGTGLPSPPRLGRGRSAADAEPISAADLVPQVIALFGARIDRAPVTDPEQQLPLATDDDTVHPRASESRSEPAPDPESEGGVDGACDSDAAAPTQAHDSTTGTTGMADQGVDDAAMSQPPAAQPVPELT